VPPYSSPQELESNYNESLVKVMKLESEVHVSQKAQETVELYRSKIAELESAAFSAKIESQHKEDEIAKLKKRLAGVEEEKAVNARTVAELQQQIAALGDKAADSGSKSTALPFAVEAELNQLYVAMNMS
jgi:chromosome segregation ATPase